MNLLPWDGLLFFGLPIGLPALFAWVYARALIAGIASAVDDHHRMTPIEPWYFFDREFRRLRRPILTVAAAGVGGILLFWWLAGSLSDLEMFLAHLSITSGSTGLAAAVATLGAPRVSSAWKLAAISSLPGALLWAAILKWTSPTAETLKAIHIFGIAAMLSWPMAWRYVRRTRNRDWFRFPE